MTSETTAGGPADVTGDAGTSGAPMSAASAAEQMAAATQALRARLPLLHGEEPSGSDPYPA